MVLAIGTAAAASFANNTSVTPARPGSMTPGNICLCGVTARGVGTPACATAGWNTVSGFPHTNSTGSGPTILLLWCVVTGSEANPTITYTGGAAGDDIIAQCVEVTGGADTTLPIVARGTFFDSINTQNIGSIPGITIQPENLVLVFAGKKDDFTSINTLTGDSLSWTEIGEPKVTTGNDAGMVWDWARNSTISPVAIAAKTFTVTGGGANFSTAVMLEIQVAQVPFDPIIAEAARMVTGLEPQHIGHTIASF